MEWSLEPLQLWQQAVDSGGPCGEESEADNSFILCMFLVLVELFTLLFLLTFFSFKVIMTMSIFPMNHANMEHSQVTHSTSTEGELIPRYVRLCLYDCIKHNECSLSAACLRVSGRGAGDECIFLRQLLHSLLWIQNDLDNILKELVTLGH